MRRTIFALACAAAVVIPAQATAQSSTAPPGNAGIDEYVETVPAAGGNRSTRDRDAGGGAPGASAGGGGLDSSLSVEARRELEAQGADGKALVQAIEATGPGGHARPDATGPVAPALRDSSSSPLSAVVGAATGGGSSSALGPLLPIILALTVALMLAAALTRRRTAG